MNVADCIERYILHFVVIFYNNPISTLQNQ